MNNNVLSFDGLAGIEMPDNTVFKMSLLDFSISFWMRQSAADGDILCKGSYYIYISEGKLCCTINDTVHTAVTYTSEADVNTSEWIHCCITASRTGLLKMYLNGVLDGSVDITTQTSILNGALQLTIGSGLGSNYNGLLDDIRIYKSAVLTLSQITAIYNDGLGAEVDETAFAAIAANGWYSDCDGYESFLVGRLVSSSVWSYLNSSVFDTDHIIFASGGVPFESDSDKGTIGNIKNWLAQTLAALTVNGEAVFTTAKVWKHQIQSVEQMDKYAPFAFAGRNDVGADSQAGDLEQKMSFSILVGQVSKYDGECQTGGTGVIGTDKLREYVLAAIHDIHPGEGFTCEHFEYAGEFENVDSPKRHMIQMNFNLNQIGV